jgi:hypothetical protein
LNVICLEIRRSERLRSVLIDFLLILESLAPFRVSPIDQSSWKCHPDELQSVLLREEISNGEHNVNCSSLSVPNASTVAGSDAGTDSSYFSQA